MAKKNEVEINIKSKFDAKGVADAKKATEELSKSTKEQTTSANADKDAKTAVEELTKAKRTLSRATNTTKKNVEKLIESQEIANIAFEEAKPKVDELAQSYERLDVATATAKKNVKELSDANKRLVSSKREVAQATQKEESAQKKSTQTKSRARSATNQLLASQTMLNKENVRAVQRGNKLNEGLMQLSYIMDDVQYGMRGILNNIPRLVMGFGASAGLAGAISIATLAGYKLYEWMNKEDKIEKELARKRAERNATFNKELGDNFELLNKISQKANSDQLAKGYALNLKKATEELREQTRLIERQISLKNAQLARENEVDSADIEAKKASVELDFLKGNISERQRNRLVDKYDNELQSRIRNRKIQGLQFSVQQNTDLLSSQKNEASEAWKVFSNLDSLSRYLPSIKQASSVIENQATAFNLYANAQAKGQTPSVETMVMRANAEKALSRYSELFSKAGIGLNLPYGDGSSTTDRIQAFQKALEQFNQKLDESLKKYEDSLANAETIAEKLTDQESNLVHLKEIDRIQTQIASIKSETKELKSDIAEEKRLSQETKQAQKELSQNRYTEQSEIVSSASIQGIPQSQIGSARGLGAREAFEEGKRKINEAISQKDAQVSAGELSSVFMAVEQSLLKNGQHTTRLANFIKHQLQTLANKLNEIDERTSKDIQQLQTGISRAIQQ